MKMAEEAKKGPLEQAAEGAVKGAREAVEGVVQGAREAVQERSVAPSKPPPTSPPRRWPIPT